MNEQRIEGIGEEMKGGLKQAVGDVTGDESLRTEGAVDRIAGTARQAVGAAQEAVAPAIDTVREAAAPAVEKARDLTRRKPWAVAALLGVVGLAVAGTLRGRGKPEASKPARRGPGRPRTRA